jgi:hypothetical protein
MGKKITCHANELRDAPVAPALIGIAPARGGVNSLYLPNRNPGIAEIALQAF